MKGGGRMEKLLEKLGLKADATEEEAVAKLTELQNEKTKLQEDNSKLVSTNQELTVSVKEEKARSETLKDNYDKLLKSNTEDEDSKKEKNIFDELSEIKR